MFKRIALYVFGVLASFILFAMPASAEGETYKWIDYNTIEVSGGDLSNTGILKLEPNTYPEKFSIEWESAPLNKSPECIAMITLTLSENSDSSGTVSHPIPGTRGSGSSIGSANPPYLCNKTHSTGPTEEDGTYPIEADFPGISERYNGKSVSISGTRPSDVNQSESPSQKEVTFIINSSKSKDTSPSSIEMTVTGQNGYNKTFSVSMSNDSESNKVYYITTIELDPGEYKVCWEGVDPDCKDFTKKKYESLILEYGESAREKVIDVTVRLEGTRRCTNTNTYSGKKVTVTNLGDNSSRELTTDELVASPATDAQAKKEKDEYPCDVNFIVSDSVRFEDIEPGTYEICTDNGNVCATVTKKAGEAAEVTLVISSDLVLPEGEPVCNTGTGFAGFLAFIICPLTAMLLNATDFIQQNLIVPYLTVSPLEVGGPVYTLWESFRNISNIVFIIAFMIIIFSQATSIGVSNYGVKKMLPRVFLVAVGVNISFFVVSFAVDMFNVLGAGIADLVLTAIPQVGGDNPDVAQGSIAALVGLGALTVAAVLTSAGAVLGWLWGLIVGAFVAVIVAMIVLVLRQMIIIILIVVSPLAFVAWLLPNTQQYFTRWRKLLIQLLAMYPLIILLFSVGKIFTALINAGSYQLTSGGGVAEDAAESIRVLLGFVASAAPLLLLPAAFATAGSMISGIQKRLQNVGQRATGAANAEAGRALSSRAKKLGYNMTKSKYKAIRGLGHLTTTKERREAKLSNQEAELQRQESKYVAQYAKDNEKFRRSATFGDRGRADSILSSSQKKLESMESEELKTSGYLYDNLLKRAGVDSKSFANGALTDYLKNGTDEVRDLQGNGIFKFSENQGLMKAMLTKAAKDGEVNTLEEARISQQLSSPEQQTMVDQVISENKGSVVKGGGYHLTTGDPDKGLGFSLANGRMKDSNGNIITDPNAMRQRMNQQRLITMSNQGANSIAGWQWSMHEAANKSLEGASGQALLGSLDAGTKTKLKERLNEVLDPSSDTFNKVENVAALESMRSKL